MAGSATLTSRQIWKTKGQKWTLVNVLTDVNRANNSAGNYGDDARQRLAEGREPDPTVSFLRRVGGTSSRPLDDVCAFVGAHGVIFF